MGLNIKNERVHELARRAAACTGRTQTGAIELALEKLLAEHEDARARKQKAIDDVLAEIDHLTENLPPMSFEYTMTDLLYDENGLPK